MPFSPQPRPPPPGAAPRLPPPRRVSPRLPAQPPTPSTASASSQRPPLPPPQPQPQPRPSRQQRQPPAPPGTGSARPGAVAAAPPGEEGGRDPEGAGEGLARRRGEAGGEDGAAAGRGAEERRVLRRAEPGRAGAGAGRQRGEAGGWRRGRDMRQRLLPVLRRALLGSARSWAAPASRFFPRCRRRSFPGYGACAAGAGAGGPGQAAVPRHREVGGPLLCLAASRKRWRRGRWRGHLVRPGECPPCPECGFTAGVCGQPWELGPRPRKRGAGGEALWGEAVGEPGAAGPRVPGRPASCPARPRQGLPGRARCAAGLPRSCVSSCTSVDKAGSVVSRTAMARL